MVKALKRNRYLCEFYFNKSPLTRSIIVFCLFLSAMLLFRFVYTGYPMFFFLAWNLFLGYLPYHLSSFLLSRPESSDSRIRLGIMIIAWLLLLPNSFYIVTDLFHLKERPPIPLWFDLSLIFSFAWLGLLFGIMSLRQMQELLEKRFGFRNQSLFLLPVMFLVALGIFIGRYLRYNSWDVITDPFGLARDILYMVIHPVRNRFDWSMIICFTLVFTFLYLTLEHLSHRGSIKKEML